MITPVSVHGTIQSIRPFSDENGMCACLKAVLRTDNGFVNVLLTPDTYIAEQVRLRRGMRVSVFYDGNMPLPLIYPPQYTALFAAALRGSEQVTVAYFDDTLSAANESLRLHITTQTQIVAMNGQPFSCPIENRLLMVFYTATTRSIPPQTTPQKVIVL